MLTSSAYIKIKWKTVDYTSVKCLDIYGQLPNLVNSCDFHSFKRRLYLFRNIQRHVKEITLNHKLNKSMSSTPSKTVKKYVPYINLSDAIFNEDEDNILQLGPKYLCRN